MSWSHQIGKPGNRKRAMPKETCGVKMQFGVISHGTQTLLDAALRAWELRKGLEPDPELIEARSHWKRRPKAC